MRKRQLGSPESANERSNPSKRLKYFDGQTSLIDDDIIISDVEEECEQLRRKVLNLPNPILKSRVRARVGKVLLRELDVPRSPGQRSGSDYCAGMFVPMILFTGPCLRVYRLAT